MVPLPGLTHLSMNRGIQYDAGLLASARLFKVVLHTRLFAQIVLRPKC